MSSSKPTAFVLSGGASLGAIQAGMLIGLYERGLAPDFIVGTSAGAFNAAYIASRPQTVATAESLGDIWRGLRRGQAFPFNPLTGLLGFVGTKDHLVPDSGLRRVLSRHLKVESLEAMPIPMHVVAVDVITGEEILLSEGPALDAVLASAAIPGVLPPVRYRDRDLIDGGVANNTPISHAVGLGARVIYVLPTGHACALREPPRSALAMALHAVSLLTQRRLIDDIEKHRDSVKLVVLPPPCPLAITPIDFSHATTLIERARDDTCEFFDRGGDQRPPIRMHMHRHDSGNSSSPAQLGPEPGTARPIAASVVTSQCPGTANSVAMPSRSNARVEPGRAPATGQQRV